MRYDTQLRVAAGLSQEELARRSGVSRATISSIERGGDGLLSDRVNELLVGAIEKVAKGSTDTGPAANAVRTARQRLEEAKAELAELDADIAAARASNARRARLASLLAAAEEAVGNGRALLEQERNELAKSEGR